MSPRDAALLALEEACSHLGRDELRVLGDVADRLTKGALSYGPLDLSKPRDWRNEGREELLDWLVYSSCLRLKNPEP